MAIQAPTIPLTIEIERKPHMIVVHCRGWLVADVCSFLHNQVRPLISETKVILLDLDGVDRMDSMGIGTLVRLYVSCKSAGCQLQLTNLGKRVREVLGITNLLGVFGDICEKGVKIF